MYKHRIEVQEENTTIPKARSTKYAVQVVIGTAPVNQAEDPYHLVHSPILASDSSEARKKLGYSDNWENYTLCQSMKANEIFPVSPVIYINVLDPNKHKKENQEKNYDVSDHQVILEEEGILKETVVIKDESDTTYQLGLDYMLTFSNEKLIVTLLSTSEAYNLKTIKVTSSSIDPSLVTEADVIGAQNIETMEETGLELIKKIRPKFMLNPALILAPGWSKYKNVAAAMQAKCTEINNSFQSECLLDLDTTKARTYIECEALKKKSGYISEHAIVLYPCLLKDNKIYQYSAIAGALMSYYTITNEDIPSESPSNKLLQVDGAVLADGTEVCLDETQAETLNASGIVTAINDEGWRMWGNNTACYPDNDQPKDRWIVCRRMFSFVRNYFINTYKKRLDDPTNLRVIDDIVNSFNIWGNSLKSTENCAGLRMEFLDSDNSKDQLREGHLTVRIYFAPYSPMEYILAIQKFDLNAIDSELTAQTQQEG